MSDDRGLMVYGFEGREVRVVMRDGEPWWVAKDVCDVLEHSNSRMALDRLDEDEKGVSPVYTPGGTQEMAVVSESGLYSLVLSSRVAKAKAFKRWITHEVIPSIRKTGGYQLVPAPAYQIPQTFAQALRLAADLQETLEAQKPLVTFAETCLQSKDSILVRELAKVAHDEGLQIGEKRLYQRLREWGLILPGKTEPSQRGMDLGLFEVIERPYDTPYGTGLSRTTKVTPKGQVYIIEKLKAGGAS